MEPWAWGLLNVLVWSVGLKAVYDLRREHAAGSRAWTLLTWALWCCLAMEAAMLLSPSVPGLALVSVVTGVLSAGLATGGMMTLVSDVRTGTDAVGGRRVRILGGLLAATLAGSVAASVVASDMAVRVSGALHYLEGALWLTSSAVLVIVLLGCHEATERQLLRPRQFAAAFAIAFLGPATSMLAWLTGATVPREVTALLSTLFVLTLVSALYAMVIRVRSRGLAAATAQVHAYEHQILIVEKLAAVSTLAAGAAHDLNSALAAIDGFTEVLLDTPDLAPSVRQDVQQIRAAARSGSAVAKDLMGVARVHAGAGGPRGVKDAVLQPLALLDREFRRRRVQVITDVPEDLPDVSIEPQTLSEVCMNLYLNARDAMASRQQGRLTLTVRPDGGGVTVSVADTGTGIPASFRSRIFQPLASTKGEHGTGLGLSVSRRLVMEAGGHITFVTDEGVGTEFRIHLPAAGHEFRQGGADQAWAQGSPSAEVVPGAGPRSWSDPNRKAS